jgi:uncharacterized BrkB/YihY/UPF0761 family membrane protein
MAGRRCGGAGASYRGHGICYFRHGSLGSNQLMNKSKLILSSSFATIITIVFVVVLTIWAELSVPIKDWLKNFSGHHWTSKSILSVLLYVVATAVLYWLLPKSGDNYLKKTLGLLLGFTIFGTLILALFFTGHHFKLF